MTSRYSAIRAAEDLANWRRVRRYAVPRWMIERATARRLAGDWRGACAVASIDVDFDLADVGRQWGKAVESAVEADLEHLAPDLLRWHLPRYLYGRTAIHPGRLVVLATYGGKPADGPALHVAPLAIVDGPQRLTLRLDQVAFQPNRLASTTSQVENWGASRHLWSARHAPELRQRCGGGNRAPFCAPDGTLLPAAELPTADPGPEDAAALTEWVTILHEQGQVGQAFSAAGITLDHEPPRASRHRSMPSLLDLMARPSLAPAVLEPEVRQLAAAGFGSRFHIFLGVHASIVFELGKPARFIGLDRKRSVRAVPGLRVRLVSGPDLKDSLPLAQACWQRLPDLDLLRHGAITPGLLHPLVSASLFPGRRQVDGHDGPPDVELPSPVLVRCRGEWHEVRSAGGRLQVPHTEEEELRERAMRAFGGAVAGCFAAKQAWTSGTGRLPRRLRDQQRELFYPAQHGDTPAVLRLLDAGVDPHIRDGRQRGLLHLLPMLDWTALLPRLLAAGLDIEARDHRQRTPLHAAVGQGPEGLVRALLDAGARTDVVDDEEQSLADLIGRYRREELLPLREALERDYPELSRRVREARLRAQWRR